MTDSRELILNRLKENAQRTAPPPVWRSHREFEDLAAQFELALTAVHGEVIRADGLETAVAALADLLQELGVKTAVANHEEPLASLNLPAAFLLSNGTSSNKPPAACANFASTPMWA
jgi:hypothetical protein